MKKPISMVIGMLFIINFIGLSLTAQSQIPRDFSQGDGVIKMENDFIEIVVNNSEDAAGRFAVLTTGGDPTRVDDNNNFLIYGLGKPVTSYSTIRIDKTDYVFGGKTIKRAGLNGNYGQVVTLPIQSEDGIYTACLYGDILVEQILDLTISTTTGQPDTASIRYCITNQGTVAQDVGLRIVLDTMLGNNDGAPFRVRDMAIVSDSLFSGEEIPAFVQAFDDLINPAVMAQANLAGPEVTKPSRVYFTNWGSLADGLWDFNFQLERDFTREGEFDLDSAMAIYWDEQSLAPGESRNFVSHYGLSGISIAKGYLSLGLSTVNKIAANSLPFDVVGYIQNTGDGIAHEVSAKLILPEGLRYSSSSESEIIIGKMAPGESSQVVWKVEPTGKAFGNMQIKMDVEAINVGVNSVTRDIEITEPAKLGLSLSGPRSLGVYDEKLYPEVFEVNGRITNDGGSTAYNVELEMKSSSFKIVHSPVFYVFSLPPNSYKDVKWQISTLPNPKLPFPYGQVKVTINAVSSNAEAPNPKELIIEVPKLEPKIWLKPEQDVPQVISNNLVWVFDLMATNIAGLKQFEIELNYDPNLLQFFGWRMGTLIVASSTEGELEHGSFEVTTPYEANQTGKLIIKGQVLEKGTMNGSLAQLKFKIVGRGNTQVKINNVVLWPQMKFNKDVLELGW